MRSIYPWIAVAVLALIVWMVKGNVSKMKEIFKLLAKLIMKIVDLFCELFNIQFIKYFQEIEEEK